MLSLLVVPFLNFIGKADTDYAALSEEARNRKLMSYQKQFQADACKRLHNGTVIKGTKNIPYVEEYGNKTVCDQGIVSPNQILTGKMPQKGSERRIDQPH